MSGNEKTILGGEFTLEYAENGTILREDFLDTVTVSEKNDDEYLNGVSELSGKVISDEIGVFEEDISCGDIEYHYEIFGYRVKYTIEPITKKENIIS